MLVQRMAFGQGRVVSEEAARQIMSIKQESRRVELLASLREVLEPSAPIGGMFSIRERVRCAALNIN
jgi:hypothetical protein